MVSSSNIIAALTLLAPTSHPPARAIVKTVLFIIVWFNLKMVICYLLSSLISQHPCTAQFLT